MMAPAPPKSPPNEAPNAILVAQWLAPASNSSASAFVKFSLMLTEIEFLSTIGNYNKSQSMIKLLVKLVIVNYYL
jgi:hypothetical protein